MEMKRVLLLVFLTIGSALIADETTDLVSVQRKERELAAEAKKKQEKIVAERRYKKAKVETQLQKKEADIKYQQKKEAAKIQQEKEKAKAITSRDINVTGANQYRRADQMTSVITSSDMSWFR